MQEIFWMFRKYLKFSFVYSLGRMASKQSADTSFDQDSHPLQNSFIFCGMQVKQEQITFSVKC